MLGGFKTEHVNDKKVQHIMFKGNVKQLVHL